MPRPRTKPKSTAPRFRSALDPESVRALLGAPEMVSLARALGLVTEKGGASPDSHRKLKQLTHFVRLVEPAMNDVLERYEAPVVIDAAAGKGYLGLVLSQLLLRPAGKGEVVGVEARADLAERVGRVADESKLPMVIRQGAIVDAELPDRAHFVLALHACDTATDEAIVRAVASRADHIAVVPCCQAEVARQLGELGASGAIAPLWGNAWHRREFGAHLTNVIRALALRAHGYQVTVTELAGWEHSVKNELILARRVARFHAPSRAELAALLAEIPVRPWLLDALAALEPPPSEDASAPPETPAAPETPPTDGGAP